jgi:hypothetical protein
MARPKPAQLNARLERLERKVAVYANGCPPSSRTAALASLTGTDRLLPRPAAGGRHIQATLRLLSAEASRPMVAPVAAARFEQPRPRFQIERTRPPRKRNRVMRALVMAIAILATAAAAGLDVKLLTGVNQPEQAPAPVQKRTEAAHR